MTADTTPTLLRNRMLAIFALQGIPMAMFFMRIPDLQLRAGLSDAQLGLILMGGPIGGITTFALASRLIERFGTRWVILTTYPAMALAAGLATIPTQPLLLFAAIWLFGAFNSVSAIAINVEADRIEGSSGLRIMNSCHGTWSIVYFLASLLAGLIRGAAIDPALHLWLMLPLFGAISLLLVWPMHGAPARPSMASSRKFVRPTLTILALVAFALGAEMLEGASRVWATIFIRDTYDVPALIESMALPALILSMAAARLVTDRIVDRYGPARVGLVASAIAFVGVAVIAFSGNAYIAIAGFAIAGLGASVGYPLMISAAARIGDRPASENVASATMVVQLVMLLSPALIGTIADGFGVRVAFGALLPLLALGMVMSRKLR